MVSKREYKHFKTPWLKTLASGGLKGKTATAKEITYASQELKRRGVKHSKKRVVTHRQNDPLKEYFSFKIF